MRIARIIAGAELHRIDLDALELFEHIVQRKLRQQGGENADSHVDLLSGVADATVQNSRLFAINRSHGATHVLFVRQAFHSRFRKFY